MENYQKIIDQMTEMFISLPLKLKDSTVKSFVQIAKIERPDAVKADKKNLEAKREKIGQENKGLIKEGDIVFTTYNGQVVKAKVIKKNDTTLTVQPLDEAGNCMLTDKGKVAKPWKRYWQVSLTAPSVETE